MAERGTNRDLRRTLQAGQVSGQVLEYQSIYRKKSDIPVHPCSARRIRFQTIFIPNIMPLKLITYLAVDAHTIK